MFDDALGAYRQLQRLHAAVNEHDARDIATLCAEDVVWDAPAATQPLRAREAVLRFHRDMRFRAIPDVRVELLDGPFHSTDRASIAVRLRMRGTMRGALSPPGFAPTGGPIAFDTAEFSYFENGLIARPIVMLDMLALARQIRAVPPQGSLAERAGIWLQRLAASRMRSRSALWRRTWHRDV